jgi:two-component system response regulator DegU
MDINMPKMDGLKATRRIHAEFPDIRIIVISMYEDQATASDALNAGAAAFLPKSGSTDRIFAAIRGEAV